MKTYLAAMYPITRRYNHVRGRAEAALDSVNTNGPDQSWSTAGHQLTTYEQQLSLLAARTLNLDPPPALRQANRKLAHSYVLLSRVYDSIGTALKAQSISQFVDAANENSLSTQLSAERASWRVAVQAAALRYHLHLPKWVLRIGTG